MSIIDRYSSAVRSSNLLSKPDTTWSDSDVIGAAGLAAKHNPLAIALTRLFTGDNSAAASIVQILSDAVWEKAKRDKIKLRRVQADDMARAVLAWFRDGVCKACGGHGYTLIEGTRTVGDHACRSCHGTGKLSFDSQFALERLLLARWLLAEVEREQAIAGSAAMAALAPRLDL